MLDGKAGYEGDDGHDESANWPEEEEKEELDPYLENILKEIIRSVDREGVSKKLINDLGIEILNWLIDLQRFARDSEAADINPIKINHTRAIERLLQDENNADLRNEIYNILVYNINVSEVIVESLREKY